MEDEEDNRQIIRDMLAGTDCEITEAENGEQALAAIAKRQPNLILMGIHLPIMDGYTVTRRIKANPSIAIDSDHRRDLPCARWGRTDSAVGRM
jgi:two-component system cell cycle response regulator DivK